MTQTLTLKKKFLQSGRARFLSCYLEIYSSVLKKMLGHDDSHSFVEFLLVNLSRPWGGRATGDIYYRESCFGGAAAFILFSWNVCRTPVKANTADKRCGNRRRAQQSLSETLNIVSRYTPRHLFFHNIDIQKLTNPRRERSKPSEFQNFML